MSHNLYFYKISRITEDLPAMINTDTMNLPYYDVHAEDAAEWEKEIGVLRTIEYSTVDQLAAGEKLFGKKPQSIRSHPDCYLYPDSPRAVVELYFPDGDMQRVHRSEMEKYRYNKQYMACIYKRENIASIEDGYMVESKEYEDRPLCREDVLEMAKKYIDD